MKRPLGFGASKRHRISMQFGYNTKPSFWQKVGAHSHLVIAAVGTVALLSVAGTALWLALPSGERQAFARHPVATEAAASEQNPGPAQVAEQKPTGNPAPAAVTAKDIQAKPAATQTAEATSAPSKPQTAAAIQEAAKAVVVAKPAQQEAADEADDEEATTEQAYAEDGKSPAEVALAKKVAPLKQDKAATAGIPATEEPGQEAEPAKASGNGTILRSVTMRSGPKKGAGVIATVPAKANVDVISCGKHKWCEIVYQNKRGWIYQGFLNRG